MCPLLALLNDVKVITNRVARDQDWLFITFEARWFGGKGKGGLISEGFSSLRLKSQRIICQISPEHYPSKGKILRRVILHLFFKDLSPSEKLSEIKPPSDISQEYWTVFLQTPIYQHFCPIMKYLDIHLDNRMTNFLLFWIHSFIDWLQQKHTCNKKDK